MAFLIDTSAAGQNPTDENAAFANFTSFITLSDGSNTIVFDVTPKISESQTVTYVPKNISQLPTSINYFDTIAARTFNVSNIKLISRTSNEATENNRVVHYLRSLCKTAFGNSSVVDDATGKSTPQHRLGMPPKILLLNGYRNEGNREPNQSRGGFSKIPVVITGFEVDWPDDVDYIPDNNLDPTPIIRTCSLNLLETHSPAQISNFNYTAFQEGKLLNW